MINFRTASGRDIDMEHPQPEDFVIEDIALGLSHSCRFAGQMPQFYSVAQHCILVSSIVDASFRTAALLHDAHEAYTCDLPRNLKHHGMLKGYRDLAENMQCVIEDSFGAGITYADRVKHLKPADDAAAIFEFLILREGHLKCTEDKVRKLVASDFVRQPYEALAPFIERLPQVWTPLSPTEAKVGFMMCFESYKRVLVP